MMLDTTGLPSAPSSLVDANIVKLLPFALLVKYNMPLFSSSKEKSHPSGNASIPCQSSFVTSEVVVLSE